MKKFFACIFVIFSLFSVSAESLTGLLNIPLGSELKDAFSRIMELDYNVISTQNIDESLIFVFYSEDPYKLFNKDVSLITIDVQEGRVENLSLGIIVNNHDEFLEYIPNLFDLSPSLKLNTLMSSKYSIIFQDTLSENILRVVFSERDGEYLMMLLLSKN